jgi:hypothetical protein
MYQNETIANTAQVKPVELPNLHSRFVSDNDDQHKLINAIQDALHKIISRREPEQKGNDRDSVKSMDNDFVSSIHTQLSRLEYHNDLLRKVLRHLEEII